MMMPRQANLQKLITIYNRHLQTLKEQQALQGMLTPPGILLQIEDIEARLAQLQGELDQLAAMPELPSQPDPLSDKAIELELARLEPAGTSNNPQTGQINISGETGSTVTVGPVVTGSVGGDVIAGDKVLINQPGRLLKILAVIIAVVAGLLALILLFSSGALDKARQPGGFLYPFYPLPTPTPAPLPASFFNVGVAQFTTLDPAVSGEEALALSKWVHNTLRDQIKNELAPESPVPANFLGPEDIGRIEGEDETARAIQAEKQMGYFNLTVLVYGMIQPGANGPEVQPLFFIPEQNKWFDYGREVGGATRLGRPIPIKLPFDGATLADTNKLLTDRVKVLGHIIQGLRHFGVNHNQEAGEEFERALASEFGESTEGQDVIHVLAGAAWLRNVGESRCAPLDRAANLKKARTAFETARDLNPDYARSYLGLGGVYLEQARVYSGTKLYQVENEQLERAYAAYSNSLYAADQPPLAHVLEKVDYGRGVVHTLGFLGQLPRWTRDKAEEYFRQVIATRNPTQAPELETFTGNAYARLCLLNFVDLNRRQSAGEAISATAWAAVEDDCRKGIDILKDIPRDRPFLAETWRLVAAVAKKQDHLSDTCYAYTEAIKIGQNYPDLCWPVAAWQSEQQQLGCQ